MIRISRRGGLRAAGAVVLAFAAMLLAAPAPSAAYTLDFTGSVTSTAGVGGGVFQALGIVVGDAVSGSVTIDPLNTVPNATGSHNSFFDQASLSYTFHLSHPGKLDLDYTDNGSGAIVTAGFPASKSGLQFQLDGATSTLTLTFQTDPTGGPLTSLAALPTSPSALIALFGGTAPQALGSFSLTGFGSVFFDIAFTTTPIPAALPLFASALGGFGVMAWRRRRIERARDRTDARSGALPA